MGEQERQKEARYNLMIVPEIRKGGERKRGGGTFCRIKVWFAILRSDKNLVSPEGVPTSKSELPAVGPPLDMPIGSDWHVKLGSRGVNFVGSPVQRHCDTGDTSFVSNLYIITQTLISPKGFLQAHINCPAI